jgi:DNA polymerase-3 subunit beta
MKFTIHRNDILDVLSKVQGLTGRKSSLAITETVLLRSAGSRVILTATDLETGFEGSYPAAVETEGTIALNSRKLFEIIRNFPSDDILINEVENRWIEIGNQKVQYNIVGMNPKDFPESPFIEDIPFFNIEAKILKQMIDRTGIIQGAGDDKRPHVKGSYFEVIRSDAGQWINLVSTDGSRLSLVQHRFDSGEQLPETPAALIPKKGLLEASKFLDGEGMAQVGLMDIYFVVKKDEESLVIRLFEGAFPQYQDIVAKKGGYDIAMDRQAFLMLLKRMSILCSEQYRSVLFNFENGKLNIVATNPDYGESKEDMLIDFSGAPIEVAFNPKFFIDTLSVIEDERIILNIVDAGKPCLIEGETDKSYFSVIMPMKI